MYVTPRNVRQALLGLLVPLAFAGCAPTLDLDAERPQSWTVSADADSALKTSLAALIPPGESGFHLLQSGHAALAALSLIHI